MQSLWCCQQILTKSIAQVHVYLPEGTLDLREVTIAWYRLHRYAWYRYSAIVKPKDEPKDEPIKPSERQQIILDYLSHNPDASKEKMSQKLKISLATLKREIDALKNLGALVREGGLKSGKWVVLKK